MRNEDPIANELIINISAKTDLTFQEANRIVYRAIDAGVSLSITNDVSIHDVANVLEIAQIEMDFK